MRTEETPETETESALKWLNEQIDEATKKIKEKYKNIVCRYKEEKEKKISKKKWKKRWEKIPLSDELLD